MDICILIKLASNFCAIVMKVLFYTYSSSVGRLVFECFGTVPVGHTDSYIIETLCLVGNVIMRK